MRKYLFLAVIAMLLFVPMVSATKYFGSTFTNVKLYEKNPTDWSIVEDGAKGNIQMNLLTSPWNIEPVKIYRQSVRVSATGLAPTTNYQLIYYGDSEHNDVWPYATCIGKTSKTSTSGRLMASSAEIPFLRMLFCDDIDQKLWLVLASDVDCTEGKMIAWNPTEYLFEGSTI